MGSAASTAGLSVETLAALEQLPAAAQAELAHAAQASPSAHVLPTFEISTPMLVMPFPQFKQQGRISKSVAAWRNEALKSGALIKYAWVIGGTGKVNEDGTLDGTLEILPGKIAIFISHTW